MASPLPQPNPSPTPAGPPVDLEQAMRQALLGDDPVQLWAALQNQQSFYLSHPDKLLPLLVETLGKGKEDLGTAIRLVVEVDDRLTASQQDRWRQQMAPTILQWQNGKEFRAFSDDGSVEQPGMDLVQLATATSDTIPAGSEWAKAAEWLDAWNSHNLVYELHSARQIAELEVTEELKETKLLEELKKLTQLKTRGILPPAVFRRAPIFHPLVLFSMRRMLKRPEYAMAALPICTWLVDNVFKTPHTQVVVETVFVVGPVVVDLARHHGVKINNGFVSGDSEWAILVKDVIHSIAANSHGAEGVAAPWQGHEKRVQVLVESCPYWQDVELAAALRRRVNQHLLLKLRCLNNNLNAAEQILKRASFSPGFESAAHVPLPDRRGPEPFWRDTSWNDDVKDDYAKLLLSLRKRAEDVEKSTRVVHSQADSLQPSREAFEVELQSPWARAALPGLAATPIHNRHAHTTSYLQERMATLALKSVIYPGGQGKLWQAGTWRDAVNTVASNPASMLQAWSALELWDGRRGCYQLGDAEAKDLIDALPAWVTKSEALLDWTKAAGHQSLPADAADLRRDLAAFTLMVAWPKDTVPDIQANLTGLVKLDKLHVDMRAMLAAAWLDLALTRVSGGVPPGIAFPQIENKTDLKTLMDWIRWATESQVAWEARAGMNALILLARLADAMDDLIIGSALGTLLPDPARLLIQTSLRGVLNDDPTRNKSALPLAFAAADLTRYARARARGIALAGLATPPAWIEELGLNASTLVRKLRDRFKLAPRTSLQAFAAAAGGAPARLLWLAVYQIELDRYERDRRLTVKAPQREKIEELAKLKQAMREVLCGDAILTRNWPAQEQLPWWQVRYWAGQGARGQDVTDTNEDFAVNPSKLPECQVVNWLITANNYPIDDILMTAAVLEAATPATPPDLPRTSDASKAALIYDASFLKDIDGRLQGEFPREARKLTRAKLASAILGLQNKESSYATALKQQLDNERSEKMIEWLKNPLRLSVADFQEQINAAIAEVRKAEAELDAAHHESLAAGLEEAVSQLLYSAAEIELKRQTKLLEISEDDEKVAGLRADIASLMEKRGQLEGDALAKLNKEIARLQVEQANLEFGRAAKAREQLRSEIETIRKVLGAGDNEEPLSVPVGTKKTEDKRTHQETIEGIIAQLASLPDNDPNIRKPTPAEIDKLRNRAHNIRDDGAGGLIANGQLAAMAVNIEISVAKTLLEDLLAAKTELAEAEAEDRAQKRKADRYALVTTVCKVVGAAVGAFFGNPVLGAEIGAAVAELGIGIAENKPPEDILLGLLDNTFAIAGAAGYDLEKELNDLGAKGLAEVNALFDSANQSLGPLLDSLPKAFDEPMLAQALQTFGLDEVPGMAEMAGQLLPALKKDFGAFTERVEGAGGLGTILKDAGHFDSAEQFRTALESKLQLAGLFTETAETAGRLAALGRTLGQDVKDLTTAKGQEEALKRVSTLVMTSLSKEAASFRSDKLTQWLAEKQKDGQVWDQVQDEAKALLDNFFPNPAARAEVESKLKSALLDPEARRAIMDGWLSGRDADGKQFGSEGGGWMGELNSKMKQLQDMQKPVSGGKRSVVARAQVSNLMQALVGFNTTLLPFLQAEQGASKARGDLLAKLQGLENELELQDYTVEIEGGKVEISQLKLQAADISEKLAELYWKATQKEVEISRAGMERATLMTEVAELAKLKQADLTKAQGLSSEAAAKRALGAQDRMRAAQANLDARKADLQGKLRRGAEASRIRTGLDRAPLAFSLDTVAKAEAKEARNRHQDHLEEALKAFREVQRFYVSIDAKEIDLLERPDDLSMPEASTWGGALQKWMKKTEEFEATVTPIVGRGQWWRLTAGQIAALTSLDGLHIIHQFKEERDDKKDVFEAETNLWDLFQPGAVGEPSRVPDEWRIEFARKIGYVLADTAMYQRTGQDIVVIRDKVSSTAKIQTYDENGKTMTDAFGNDLQWAIHKEIEFRVDASGVGKLRVYKFLEGKATHDNFILEGLTRSEISTGRVLGVFLRVHNPGGGFYADTDYGIKAEHTGPVILSPREMRLRWPVDQKAFGDRTNLLSGNKEPEAQFEEDTKMLLNEGDFGRLTAQGLPLGGATVLRLFAKGSAKEFREAELNIYYKYYQRPQQVAALPGAVTAAVA